MKDKDLVKEKTKTTIDVVESPTTQIVEHVEEYNTYKFPVNLEDIDLSQYPEIINNYDFDKNLQDYCDKIKLYSCKNRYKYDCMFYKYIQSLEDEDSDDDNYDDSEDYIEQTLELDFLDIDINIYKALHRSFLEYLNIPSDISDTIEDLQIIRSYYYKMCVCIKNNKIISINLCYTKEDKEKYENISNTMGDFIQQEFLSLSSFCKISQQNIINFLLHAHLFNNAIVFDCS
ncbi:hypothetical protein AB837_00487 [bacterium AB1]|nr:hypothetical protein AB837_00487 [bacterium AB1]